MSNDPAFQCPVCRAKQTLRDTCRRCKADLSLVARAYRRLEYLLRLQAEARGNADQERMDAVSAELQWIAPKKSRARSNKR
jgi:hypothetical protein